MVLEHLRADVTQVLCWDPGQIIFCDMLRLHWGSFRRPCELSLNTSFLRLGVQHVSVQGGPFGCRGIIFVYTYVCVCVCVYEDLDLASRP